RCSSAGRMIPNATAPHRHRAPRRPTTGGSGGRRRVHPRFDRGGPAHRALRAPIPPGRGTRGRILLRRSVSAWGRGRSRVLVDRRRSGDDTAVASASYRPAPGGAPGEGEWRRFAEPGRAHIRPRHAGHTAIYAIRLIPYRIQLLYGITA